LTGGAALLEWFNGRVPSFHDAEVLTLTLEREGEIGSLRIYTFEMTSETDANGYFVLRKHAVVSFQLAGITGLELTDFNHQNVIGGLSLSRTSTGGFRLELESCYGLFGVIEAQTVSIAVEPRTPPAASSSS
jgi:hypothetical protein